VLKKGKDKPTNEQQVLTVSEKEKEIRETKA